jgi:cell division protein FtsB
LFLFVFTIFSGKRGFWDVETVHQDKAKLKRATPVEAFNI